MTTRRGGPKTTSRRRKQKMSNAQLNEVPANVRTIGDQFVTITAGDPWPGVYRGSKYSILENGTGHILVSRYQDLDIPGEMPKHLIDSLRAVNKSGGDATGSIRITADREVLTKVHADNYPHVDRALIDTGWIPVYLGKLNGTIDFGWLENDPGTSTMEPPCVWEGLPFKHGERWSVTVNGDLQWRINRPARFRFPSAYSHNDLSRTYSALRSTGGRMRINEYGHLWMEFPVTELSKQTQTRGLMEEWFDNAKRQNRNRISNLLFERLKATGNGNPSNGNLPIYLGHISNYDDGHAPSPVITDQDYYLSITEVDNR